MKYRKINNLCLFSTEPIQSLLRNMKTFEYTFHQHHHLMQAAAVATMRPELSEMALDLTKPRRDSIESDTRKSSSFEDSPNARESPNHPTQLLMHQRNLPKHVSITPEHTLQYHYNFEHSSPSTSSALKNISTSQSPQYEKFDAIPVLRKVETPEKSSSPIIKSFAHHQSPPHHHYEQYQLPKLESSYIPPPIQSPVMDHEDSNDLPSANISSSSSVTSSQKSPSSSTASNPSSMMVVTRDGKLSRPFKAYPRDPLSLAAAGSILDSSSAEKYAVFRKRMLDQIHAANGGSVVVNNPKMRRVSHNKTINEETNNNEPVFPTEMPKAGSVGNDKDEAYFERRKKNNAAAKKSRDRRRIKEDEIAIRAAFLERENIELKFELAAARKQLAMYTNGITSA